MLPLEIGWISWATLVFPAGKNTMLGMPAFAQ